MSCSAAETESSAPRRLLVRCGPRTHGARADRSARYPRSARHRGHAQRAAPSVRSEPRERDRAYDDAPLPIGEGQTISQPYIVALMTELVRPQPERPRARSGHGLGLPGRRARRGSSRTSTRSSSKQTSARGGRDGAARAEVRQCHRARRRRLRRLARARALRHHHGDRRAGSRAAAADRPAQAGRPADRARRTALHRANSCS